MTTPIFEVDEVVDVKRGAVSYRRVRVRNAANGSYEGTYRVKAKNGNPAYTNTVRFTGAQVTACYYKVLARYGD